MQSHLKVKLPDRNNVYTQNISMKKYLIILAVTALSRISYAQNEFEYTILKNNSTKADPVMVPLHAQIEDLLADTEGVHLADWDEKTHKLNYMHNKKLQRPIALVKFCDIRWINTLNNIDLTLVTDTTGKTKEAYFRITSEVKLVTKQVEVKTSQIIDIKQNNFKSEPRTSLRSDKKDRDIILIEKFVEEFGGDPAKLKKDNFDTYNKRLVKVREKYMPQLKERLSELLVLHAGSVVDQLKRFEPLNIGRAYQVIRDPDSADEKKIKSVTFDATPNDHVKAGEYVLLYEVVDFNGHKSLRYVSPFRVDETGEKSAKADLASLGGKKALAELMRNKAELVMFDDKRSALAYDKQLRREKEDYIVGVKKSCVFCNMDLETSLYQLPIVKVVERNAPELVIFQKLAKLERFIDYGSEELLNKQLGVKYLFYKEEERLVATDIETGRIIGSERPPGWLSANYGIAAKNLFIDTFERPIKFIKNEEVSKGKLKSFIAQSDFGFLFGESIGVYELVDEKVGNKVIKRKQEIGDSWFSKPISDTVAEFKVKRGEKEILEAQQQGKTLVFEYKIK